MGNPGRKLARQVKRSTPEGKEELKQQEQEKKQAAPPPSTSPVQNQRATGHQPTTRVFQRRSGNS